MPLTPGTRLGPYEIVAALGAGGMGEVYRARDTRLDRTVAIKVLPAAIAGDPQFRERFEREGRTLSQIDHPHICALYDIGTHEGAAYIVMQYLEGETLAARLARGPLTADQALKVGIEICDALDTAHRHDIIHRDLKPGNIMLTKTGARLLDFGLAKQRAVMSLIVQETVAASGPLTGEGTILGTPHYMAPEQLKGMTADARSDIFALGVVLYEMISGRRPFEAPDSATLVASILERNPPPLAAVGAVPPRLARAIQTALEKNPDDRWQTSRDLLRELRWLATEQTSTPISTTTPAVITARRPPRRWIVGGLVATALLALAAWVAFDKGDATGAAATPVVVLMDSSHPQRIYDPATLKAGGTNADDLTDLLRDLPVVLLKETTGTTWHREDQVLSQNPDLVLVHRSCFYDATLLPEPELNTKYFEQLYQPAADKLETVLGYLALGNPRTRFVVYSRGSWQTEEARDAWVAATERRFPRLKGRLTAYKVPLDRATFRNPQTAAEIKQIATSLLAARRP